MFGGSKVQAEDLGNKTVKLTLLKPQPMKKSRADTLFPMYV